MQDVDPDDYRSDEDDREEPSGPDEADYIAAIFTGLRE